MKTSKSPRKVLQVAYETGRLLAGAGVHAQQEVYDPDGPGGVAPAVTGTKYLHGDMTRSTMLQTDEYGEAVSPTGCRAVVGYTAFGEPVVQTSATPSATLLGGDLPAGFVRFGYDGGWGYQAGLNVAAPSTEADDPLRGTGLLSLYGPRADLPPIALQHVGARWYDPGLGRFVQRDPIGIEGGLNVYAYTANNPVVGVDPEGELFWVPVLILAGAALLIYGTVQGCRAGNRLARTPNLANRNLDDPNLGNDGRVSCVNAEAYRENVQKPVQQIAENAPGSSVSPPPTGWFDFIWAVIQKMLGKV